jgi:uncharacterized protein (TIGR03000 family)
MIRRLFLFGAPLFAAAALLLTPAESQAQRFGGYRGGWGGYSGGWGGYNSGWRGSYYPGYSYGWGGYYSPSYNYGWGSSYYQPGYSYYPSSSYYYPNYSYYPSSSYYYPYYSTYLTTGDQSNTTGYQSSYPPDTENANVAFVRVEVPMDADVIFEGQKTEKTQQGGTDRLYVTPPLEKDKKYYYEVKARWMDNGKEVERTKRVDIQAGGRAVVDFMNEGQQPNRTNETAPEKDRTTTPEKEPANRTPPQR